jgi:hypothetical protein
LHVAFLFEGYNRSTGNGGGVVELVMMGLVGDLETGRKGVECTVRTVVVLLQAGAAMMARWKRVDRCMMVYGRIGRDMMSVCD